MRTVLLDHEGKPLLLRDEETNEVFEVGEPAKAAPWERHPPPLRWPRPIIDDPHTPFHEPWRVIVPLSKPEHLPAPEIVRPAPPQIVPVHGLGDPVEREQHELRSRAMHRLGVDIPVDDVKRRRREEALRRLKDPEPVLDVENDARMFIDGLRRRPVM
jgi:hypothetical protein